MSLSELRQTMPIADEKLEEYLAVWNTLIEKGHKGITLTQDYDCSRSPFGPWIYTLTYGEERRELTYEQAWRVKDWLNSLGRFT